MPGPGVELDAVELWVGDLGQTRHFLETAFGFESLAVDDGPEEEMAHLAGGAVSLILRRGTSAESAVARHVALHGDTLADVALAGADPGAIVERALAAGLRVFGSAQRPTIDLSGQGTVCHSVQRTRLADGPAPGSGRTLGMGAVDHVAYCLPWGTIERTAGIYEDVFGLERLDVGDCEVVGAEGTGMRSAVLRSPAGFTVVLTEPSAEGGNGQTQRFVDAHGGPGVQHIAIAYDDLITAMESLRSRGVQFLSVPAEYFDQAEQRVASGGDRPVPWDALRRLGILVDHDEQGLLFQIFTRPLGARPTFFFELIQRSGATGFGANNVRALFAAVQAAHAET